MFFTVNVDNSVDSDKTLHLLGAELPGNASAEASSDLLLKNKNKKKTQSLLLSVKSII